MGAYTYPVIDLVATGKNIRDLRKAKGLSVADLQEYFGFEAPQAIYKWQAGKSLPSTDNLFALSHLLGVPIDEILVPVKPRFKSMPQEDSCGVDIFGILYTKQAYTNPSVIPFRARCTGMPGHAYEKSSRAGAEKDRIVSWIKQLKPGAGSAVSSDNLTDTLPVPDSWLLSVPVLRHPVRSEHQRSPAHTP